MRSEKNNTILGLYHERVKNRQKNKEKNNEYHTTLESYNNQLNDKEEKKRLKYRIAKALLLLALMVFMFRLIYFGERTPQVDELSLYQNVIYLPLFLIFIAFIFFINAFIGVNDKFDDDECD